MKRKLISLAVLICFFTFLVGCSEQKAEKEYKRILDAELKGSDPSTLITQYQALVSQYPDTASATRAQERLIALKTKIETETRKAEREQKERELKAAQEEKDRVQRQKEREALEEEVKRQVKLLAQEMAQATKNAALKLHADTEVTETTRYGDHKATEDWDKKIWTFQQTSVVKLKGTLLGLNTYSEIIECGGQVRLNEVTKQFERSVAAKPAATK